MRVLFGLLCVIGCASGPPPPVTMAASVSGTISGQSFVVNDTVSGIYRQNADTASAQIALIEGDATECSHFTAGMQIPNLGILVIQALVRDAAANTDSVPTSPGTFTVPLVTLVSGNYATVQYQRTDSGCAVASAHDAVSGTVTLTTVDENGFGGSGDVTFDTGDHVTFAFAAPACAALAGMTTIACAR